MRHGSGSSLLVSDPYRQLAKEVSAGLCCEWILKVYTYVIHNEVFVTFRSLDASAKSRRDARRVCCLTKQRNETARFREFIGLKHALDTVHKPLSGYRCVVRSA